MIALLVQALEAAQAQIQLCSMLELLLLRKKSLRHGDSLEVHADKVIGVVIISLNEFMLISL